MLDVSAYTGDWEVQVIVDTLSAFLLAWKAPIPEGECPFY